MVEPIETHSEETIRFAPRQRVYVKEKWADEWRPVANLWCRQAKWVCGPDVSSATFEWEYGKGINFGETYFQVVEPQQLDDQFVKVECVNFGAEEEDFSWYGIFKDETRTPNGYLIDPETGDEVPTGRQQFTAYGLEILLAQEVLLDSVVDPHILPFVAIPFNGGSGRGGRKGPRGNRELVASGDDDTFKFGAKIGLAEWTAADILRYCLASSGTLLYKTGVPFKLDAANAGVDGTVIAGLDRLKPLVEVEGRTLKDVVDEVLSRKRLLSWYLEVRGDGGGSSPATVYLVPFSFNDEDLPLASESEAESFEAPPILPANSRLRSLNFELDVSVRNARLERRTQQRCDLVLVASERRTSTFTMQAGETFTSEEDEDEQRLAIGWTDEEQTRFNKGASESEGYPSVEDQAKWDVRTKLNSAARGAESLRHVFTRFRLPDEWQARVGGKEVHPLLRNGYELDEEDGQAFWQPSLRFLAETALVVGKDYRESAEPTTLAGQEDLQYRDCFAVAPVTIPPAEEGGDETKIYVSLERHSGHCSAPSLEVDRVAGSLRCLRNEPAIELRPSGDQWAFAQGRFEPLPGTDDVDGAPTLDVEEFFLTLCLEFDPLQIFYPRTDPDEDEASAKLVERIQADGLPIRILRIEVADARLDYLVPGTIVDVDEAGQLVRTEKGGWLRDDRRRLDQIARQAFAWYSTERNAFTISFQGLTKAFLLGDLITEIGGAASLQTVRTPITSVEWNFDSGETTLQTDFAELRFS